jgi:hypothetical protein
VNQSGIEGPPAATSAPATAVASSAPPDRRSLTLTLITVAASLAALAWAGAVALSAGHGFDRSDEGFYLLSYRWWNTDYRTFTGAQYLYGPVFQATGYNIAALRIFRLVTVLGAHAAFGWAFMRWLRLSRPSAPTSRLWEVAGTMAIVAAGGVVYGWLPLSPGYNDVTVLGALVSMALVLFAAVHAAKGRPVPAWVPLAWGPVIIAMVLAKWTAAGATLLVIGVVALVLLWPRGIREIGRIAAWLVASLVISCLAVDLLVVPLTTAIPQMLAVNRLAVSSSNSPANLLHMYWNSGVAMLRTTITQNWLLLLAVAVAVVSRRRGVAIVALVLGVAGLGWSTWRAVRHGGLGGGVVNLARYPVLLVAALLAVLVAVLVSKSIGWRQRRAGAASASQVSSIDRDGWRVWLVLAALLVLPVAQALGTGNPLYFMAVNGFAAWMAIIIAVLTGIDQAPVIAKGLVATVAAAAVIVATSVGAAGVWYHPYRTRSHAQTTALAAGVPALSSLRLDPQSARQYSDLYQQLKPYLLPPGRAMMGFDEMSGLILALGGRPVGEAWYSRIDRARSAAGIRADCAGGHPWWGQRLPIILFDRPVSDSETAALQACGLSLANDYRLLPFQEDGMNLTIYVPLDGPSRGAG